MKGETLMKSNWAKNCEKVDQRREGHRMLFTVIERFKDAKAVYRRVREKGRMLPEGLKYVESWVETNYNRCFQLMECKDTNLFQKWTIQWQDLIDFEIVPVVKSKQAAKMIEPSL